MGSKRDSPGLATVCTRDDTMIRDQMENACSETPPEDIPWNIESPP